MADLRDSMHIAGSGLAAQTQRMKVISQNIANSGTTGSSPTEDPYRRQTITFKNELDRELGTEVVKVGRIATDPGDFRKAYQPGHPAADTEGYVNYPNVDTTLEQLDMRQAQRTYEANLGVIQSTQQMLQATVDILR